MAASNSAAEIEEAFGGASTGQERRVARIDVAQQEAGTVGVGTGYQQGGNPHHVRGQAGGDQLLHELADWHHHLAAHVAALLGGRELVFEVHRGGAGFDHGLHEFEGIEGTAEARLGIRHYGGKPVALFRSIVP